MKAYTTRIIFCLICSWLLTLCACGQPNSDILSEDGIYSENESYKMYIEDGKWYIEFPETSAVSKDSANMSGTISYPVFDSAADMKQMLSSKEMPDSMVQKLKAVCVADGRKRLELCDPNKICELTTPEGVLYERVSLYGASYSFRFGKYDLGYVNCVDEESYDKRFEKMYLNAIGEDYTVYSDAIVEDRNARVVHASNSNCELKKIFYKITVEELEICVVETYVFKFFSNLVLEKTSETVPLRIDFFGYDGENHWYGWFTGFEERPSVEWLSSFRLTPIE